MKRLHYLLLAALAFLLLPGCVQNTTPEEDYAALTEAVTLLDLPPQEDDSLAYRFSEGLSPVKRGDLWGFLDKSGQIVIEPAYTNVGGFSEGLALVSKDGLFGYIDHSGQEVIPPQFQDAVSFSDGWASVLDGEGWVLIDQSGAPVPDFDYSHCGQTEPLTFRNGYAVYVEEQPPIVNADETETIPLLYGLVDKTGAAVIPAQFDQMTSFSHGYAFAHRLGEFICVDETGTRVLTDWYLNVVPAKGFSDDGYALLDALLPTEKERRTVLVNAKFEIVSSLTKLETGHNVYYEGLIFVPNPGDTKIGAVDLEGNLVIPMVLDLIGPYSDGVLEAYVGGDKTPVYICNPLL